MAVCSWVTMAYNCGLNAADDDECYTKAGYALKTYGEMYARKELKLFYAVPNGGLRNKIVAAKLKATGSKAGVPDMNLDFPLSGFHGLRIELKRPKTHNKAEGKLSSKQSEIMQAMNSAGYLAISCVGWIEATQAITKYLLGNYDVK